MTQSTNEFCQNLLKRIYTTETLKVVSDCLEELSQNTAFKQHTSAIINDSSLTSTQKRSQLLYAIRAIDEPLLYDFFSDIITAKNLWLFDTRDVEYFDEFVKSFQMMTETVAILFLTTATPLKPNQIKTITTDLGLTFGQQIIIKHEINPAIMGGAIARLGNAVYDLSIRTRFTQFQRHWLSTLEKTSKTIGRFELATNSPDLA